MDIVVKLSVDSDKGAYLLDVLREAWDGDELLARSTLANILYYAEIVALQIEKS